MRNHQPAGSAMPSIQQGGVMQRVTVLLIGLIFLSGCGIQSIPKSVNQVEAAVAEVTNQYKRRADLIPNLVKTVKGYASHEKETLQAVVEARANATRVSIDPSKSTPEQIQKYQQAQGGLSQALGRLMMISEKYPDLKADRNFRELQAQLEGTENRITIARQRHIQAIQQHNDLISVPPSSWINNLMYHHEKLSQWALDDAEQKAVEQAPEVNF
jgi:LemA protein